MTLYTRARRESDVSISFVVLALSTSNNSIKFAPGLIIYFFTFITCIFLRYLLPWFQYTLSNEATNSFLGSRNEIFFIIAGYD